MVTENRKLTGIEGLDEVLHGGLMPNNIYLVEGEPGSGKTTLGLQFLLAGCRDGEPCLYVTLSESEEELRASAVSHGWDLNAINILEIVSSEDNLRGDARYTMFHPSEVELGKTIKTVLAEAERIKSMRLVIDSLSGFRLLAESPFRYRQQILALRQYFSRQQCTVIFIDEGSAKREDTDLRSLVHGVISLDRHTAEYGTSRRRIQVIKVRGQGFHEGYHNMVIKTGGIEVFPRRVAVAYQTSHTREAIKSGLEGFDTMLGGGLSKGTSALLLGTAGTGKSSLATQFVCAAGAAGKNSAMFLFDEATDTLLERSAGLGMNLEALISAGRVSVQQVNPAELSPGEFAHRVRHAVEKDKAGIVVIDTLNGYLNAIPSERFLMLHLHELLIYLGLQGVTTLILMDQSGIIGNNTAGPVDASYLADTVVLLRYFEAFGEMRKSISVIKKRTGNHERTIRELRFDQGIKIGEPVHEFQGVLTGQPLFIGKNLQPREEER